MTFARPIGRLCGVIAAVAAIVAVAIHVSWAPASPNVSADAITVAAGLIGPTPATANASIVMTGPVGALANGDAVHFTVNTAGGVTLNKVEAHICAHGYTTYSTTTFGFANSGGTRCVYAPNITTGALTGIEAGYKLGPLAFAAVTTSGDQVFHAGSGTVDWVNSNGNAAKGAPAPGAVGPLTCDSSNPCDLVVDAGLTNDAIPETFFIQPLTFAGTVGTTTTTAATTSTTTTAPGTTTTTAPGTTTTTQPSSTTSTTTKPGSTTTTAPTSAGGTVTPSTVPPGGSITVQSSGWQAGSSESVTLHSDPVTLGALTADASGNVSGNFSVPAATATGAHTVVIDGKDAQGATRQVTLNITVATSTTGGATTGTGTGTSTAGALAFTGDATRNLASAALLLIAAGLFLLGQASRRRAAPQS
jgi:hypothetical protein